MQNAFLLGFIRKINALYASVEISTLLLHIVANVSRQEN
jgi:hypothetical protein